MRNASPGKMQTIQGEVGEVEEHDEAAKRIKYSQIMKKNVLSYH